MIITLELVVPAPAENAVVALVDLVAVVPLEVRVHAVKTFELNC